MGHIGEKGALGAVGGLGGSNGIRKRLVHLFISGAVGHDKDVLVFALYLAAHGNDVEPARLSGLLMQIRRVPLALFPAVKPLQKILVAVRVIFRVQCHQSMDILPDVSPRDAQQTAQCSG